MPLTAAIRRPCASALGLLTLVLAACTSLAPQIRAAAIDHSDVLEAFTTQSLVVNVLRARDRAPLSFADLPIIRGSLNVEAGASLSVPFGYRGANSDRSVFGPSVKFTSAPTFETVPLNKQTFTLGLLQPVSPVFVESLWNAGYPRQLLLHLFAESIRLPGGDMHLNDPEREDRHRAFTADVESLIRMGAELRTYTVLSPLGPPIAYPDGSASTAELADHLTMLQLPTDQFVIDVEKVQAAPAMAASAPGPRAASAPAASASTPARVRIHRRTDVQLICYNAQAKPNPPARDPNSLSTLLGNQLVRPSGGALLNLPAANVSPKTTEGASKPATAGAIGPDRMSSIFSGSDCEQTVINIDRTIAAGPATPATQGAVRWRSTADAFRYLGAVLRRRSANAPEIEWSEPDGTHRLFSIVKSSDLQNRPARITIDYLGTPHSIPFADAGRPQIAVDHTLDVLGLMKLLVDAAKFADEVPVTRTLRVIP